MSPIDLVDVAQELATQVGTILNGRATPYPPDTILPPFGYVFGPESGYDLSYGRGLDSVTLSVTVAVARTPIAEAWKQIFEFLSGSGDRSVKAVLESGSYQSFHTIQVTGSRDGVVNFAGNEYTAAVFTVSITGSGS